VVQRYIKKRIKSTFFPISFQKFTLLFFAVCGK